MSGRRDSRTSENSLSPEKECNSSYSKAKKEHAVKQFGKSEPQGRLRVLTGELKPLAAGSSAWPPSRRSPVAAAPEMHLLGSGRGPGAGALPSGGRGRAGQRGRRPWGLSHRAPRPQVRVPCRGSGPGPRSTGAFHCSASVCRVPALMESLL